MTTDQTRISTPSQTWCKSRQSTAEHACLEVASLQGIIGVRDSKNPQGEILTFDPRTWTTFLNRIKLHELDL